MPTRRTNALGHTFGYHYDKARRLVGLTNENGARYRFAYDVLDRLIAESGFDHKLTGYRYNAGNERVEQRKFGDDASLAAKLMAQLGGQPVPKKDTSPLSDDLDSQNPLRVTEFKRDILGRLIHTLARDNDRVQETAYQYDLDGNLVRAANSHSITCFDYNENGRLIAQHQWKVPSKEENARNGLPDTDWRDAQYDMLYLPVTETVRYHYDFTATVPPPSYPTADRSTTYITAAATCTKSASTTKSSPTSNAMSCTAKSTVPKVNSPAVTNSTP